MADDDRTAMVRRPAVTPTPENEVDRTLVTARQVARFIAAASPNPAPPGAPPTTAPLSFALVLRRGDFPKVRIAPDAFAIHGGHDLDLHHPIRIGETYTVRGRIEDVFEKTGRSGPMTVVVRRVQIHDSDGRAAVTLCDRQIVRWRPTASPTEITPPAPMVAGARHIEDRTTAPPEPHPTLEVGTLIGPLERPGPSADDISAWAGTLRNREVLFHDRPGSNKLGYRDLVVPGPMQSAFIDDMLRSHVRGWTLRALSMTFRQSLIAGDPLSIHAVVIEADDAKRVLDVVVENTDTGETTSVGVADLIPTGRTC